MDTHDRIKQRRLELGLSADDVAKALNVSRATIYRYESNDIEKLPTTILKPLANILRCDVSYLMGWEEDFPTEQPTYYTNPATAQIAQEIYESKELSLLFDAARDAKPEDLKQVHDMLLFLKQKERGE